VASFGRRRLPRVFLPLLSSLLLELRRSSDGIRGHDDHDRQISTGGVIRWFLALLLVLFVCAGLCRLAVDDQEEE